MTSTSSPDESVVEEQPLSAGEQISAGEELFERIRKLSGVFLAPVAFFVAYFATAGHVGPQGQMLSAILSACAVLWMTEPIPLPITALLGAVLCITLGVADARSVLASFADPFIFLFLASFILARSMMVHGLDRRIALRFLAVPGIGASPARLMAGVGAVTAFISMWVSNTATTAMMLPIALGVLGALHHVRVKTGLATGPMDPRRWPYATGMMLMVAYGASIGGIGTPVGSPPNLIGLGLIEANAKVKISFFEWMALMVPLLVVMAIVLFFLLYLLHPVRDGSRGGPGAAAQSRLAMSDYLRGELDRLGRWTPGQRNTLLCFILAVVLWIVPGFISIAGWDKEPIGVFFRGRMTEAVVAMVAAILLFILPTNVREGKFTMTWGEATKIDWGTLLLFGGGLSLGSLMEKTGVAAALGSGISQQLGAQSIWAMTAAAIVVSIFLSETTSNTAAAAMIVPVVIALAKEAGVSPVPPALAAVLGASYGFMLPVSTPPNAIVYGSGLVPIPKMVRAGFLFDLIGAVVIWTGLRVMCPIMGLA